MSEVHINNRARLANAFADVSGRCPSCGENSLFLAVGGHVTCSIIGCKDPCAAANILLAGMHREEGHPGDDGVIWIRPYANTGADPRRHYRYVQEWTPIPGREPDKIVDRDGYAEVNS